MFGRAPRARPSRRRPWPSWTPRPRPGARRPRPGHGARSASSGAACAAQLGEVAGEAEVARRRRARPRVRGERGARRRRAPRARARRRASGAGLRRGRVAVVPAAVQAPHVAHDELGLVVDRPQVRPWRAARPARAPCARMSSRRAPSFISASVWSTQGLEQRRRCRRARARTRSAPTIGRPWPGQQHLGVERRPSSRSAARPLARVALHLLRVAAVRRRPDEQVAGAQRPARPAPTPRCGRRSRRARGAARSARRRRRGRARRGRSRRGSGTRSATNGSASRNCRWLMIAVVPGGLDGSGRSGRRPPRARRPRRRASRASRASAS